MLNTKARLFGESKSDNEEAGEQAEGEDSFEIDGDEDPEELVKFMYKQMKQLRRAYKQQVLNNMKVVKKMRYTHNENKKLKAVLAMEREQARLAKELNVKVD